MHIVSNIRNLEKFLKFLSWAANDALSEEEYVRGYNIKDLRAHQYDLIIAKAIAIGATLSVPSSARTIRALPVPIVRTVK